jgi:carboxylesterase
MLSNQEFYHHKEQGTACLLLHGLGGGIYELQPLGEVLHQRGISVMGFNYPGHDQQVLRMPESKWEQWLERIHFQYEALAKNHDTVHVVGFSTGCPLALKLLETHPVGKLILLSPFLAIKHQWYYGMRPEFYVKHLGHHLKEVPRLRLPIKDPGMLRHAEKAAFMKSFNLKAVQSALNLIEGVKSQLHRVENDTLIIQSSQDRIVDPSGAQYLMDNLGSSQKTLQWLNRSDHVISLDWERLAVYEQIMGFIQPESSV